MVDSRLIRVFLSTIAISNDLYCETSHAGVVLPYYAVGVILPQENINDFYKMVIYIVMIWTKFIYNLYKYGTKIYFPIWSFFFFSF